MDSKSPETSPEQTGTQIADTQTDTGLLEGRLPRQHVGDAILGAIDGIITTFVVISGAIGAQFSGTVIVILGFASLLGDGLSMGVSNYLGSKSDQQLKETKRKEIETRIRSQPEKERESVRQIYREKGLAGETLDRVMEVITGNREQWAKEIAHAEVGRPEETSVIWSGVATSLAFIIVGAIPLLPFLFGDSAHTTTGANGNGGLLAILTSGGPVFYVSLGLAAVTFFLVGAIKGKIVGQSWWRAGLETLATGGGAAVIAYLVGYFLRQTINASGML